MDFLGIIRTVVDRAFYFSCFVGLFSGLVLTGQHFGMEISHDIIQWIQLAFLASISLVVVECGRRCLLWIGDRRLATAEKEDALKNMSSLFSEERGILKMLISDGAPRRFQVGPLSPIYPLLQKGVVKVVRDAGGAEWICEVHPTIYERRSEISPKLPAPKRSDFE